MAKIVLTGRNVPVKELATGIGKDQQFVRVCVTTGVWAWATAIKMPGKSKYNFYLSDKDCYEQLGYYNPAAYIN